MKHWTELELVEKMYGVGPGDAASLAHLAACPDCQSRLNSLEASRLNLTVPPPVSEAFLRDQRSRILDRIETPSVWHNFLRPLPALATALVLVMGWMLHQPASAPRPEPVAGLHQVSDAQLFSEIATLANSDEPRAAASMHGLFAGTDQEF